MSERPELHTEIENKKASALRTNLVLAAGLAFVMAGVFLLAGLSSGQGEPLPVARSLLTTLAGALILYLALVRFHGRWILCCGLFLFATGIFILLVDVRLFPRGIDGLWPVIIIIAGGSVFAAGCYNAKKIRLSFLVPAAAIIFLGVLFLLFSMDVITVSFKSVAARWWPSVFIVTGTGLVALFFLWNRSSPLSGIAEEDEDDFSDISDGDSGRL